MKENVSGCFFSEHSVDFIDIARRSSAGELQLHYTALRGFVSDSWAFLFEPAAKR